MLDGEGEPLVKGAFYWVVFGDNKDEYVPGEYNADNDFYECGYDWARPVIKIGPRILPPEGM